MSDAITKQVTGVCNAITERNGWTEFEIHDGGAYPTKVSTKLQPLVELGRAAGSKLAVWTYKESDGNPNPNKPGTFFKNRYLEKVEVGGTADSPPPRIYEPDLKDRMIVRQTCLKAASALYSSTAGLGGENDWALDVMKAAQRFETWVYRDIDDPPSDAGSPPLSEHDQEISYPK